MSSSSDTATLEKYEFGQETNDHDDDVADDEGKQSDSEPVSFQVTWTGSIMYLYDDH